MYVVLFFFLASLFYVRYLKDFSTEMIYLNIVFCPRTIPCLMLMHTLLSLTALVSNTSLPLTASLSIHYHQLPLSCIRHRISDSHFFSFILSEQLDEGKTTVAELMCKQGCAI